MAGSETSSAAAITTAAMNMGGAARSEVVIQRPAAGAITVSEAPAGANLKLNFASVDAKILVQDVDIVLAFPDGGRVVLPGFAFNLVSAGGTQVAFTDRTETAQQLFASVSDLRLIDNLSSQTISNSADKDGGVRDEAHAPAPPPAPPPTPASTPARQTSVADFEKPPEDPLDHSPRLPVVAHNVAPSSSGLPPTDKTSTATTAFTSNDHGNGDGDGNVKAADLDIKLLGVTKETVVALPGGGRDIHGAAAAPGADADPSFNVQQLAKHIDGTAHDDVIHALDPARMPSGTFERLIDITGRLPDPGVVAETAVISGLPEGFAINNATQSGDKWIVQLSKFDPNHFQIELRYVLPPEGTAPDANGILGDFNLSVMFKTHDSKGGLHLYAGTQIFVTREIHSEADVTASASGVGKMYALNATPPGTEISAGEGNDTVYAGAGHDTLDGGSGANLVSYAESSSGVMVDLLTGQGQGGYATGDVLRNFSSIEGSAFADRLLGTTGDNNFYGHGGADTIIGNGGHDVVYFDASEEAVSVNLETGEVSGGPGSGSLLIGISDVVGSVVAGNTLIGTADANRLTGGSSADTIDGRGGADVIGAGRGDDRVSYYATENSVDGGLGDDTLVMKGAATIDLTQADQSVGGGGTVSGFEHNRLIGGAGDDRIDGGGGRDDIDAGAGNDRVDYHGRENSIDGGDGKNEFKAWLVGVVKIGEEYDEAGAMGRVVANQKQWTGMIGHVLSDYARVAGSFDHAAQLLADMRGAQQAQTDAVERIIGELAQMQGVQTRLLQEITAAASVAPALGALGAGVESMAATLSRRMETEALALRELLAEAQRTRSSDMRMMSAHHAQTTSQLAEAIGQLSLDVDRRSATTTFDSARLEAALERGVSGAGRALGEKLDGVETRLARLAESQAQSLDALTRMTAAGGRDDSVGQALEGAVSAGFARLSQTMETAFSAYSSLLHVVVARMEQAAASVPAVEIVEPPPPAARAEDALAEAFRRRAGESARR